MKTLIKTLTALSLAFLISIPAFASGLNDDIRTIHIKGTDNMKFDISLIEATPGETILITFESVSNLPKQAMGHNIAIIDLGVDLEEFVMASIRARDNDYIAPEFEDRVIAHTAMIGGGETSTIEFTVPETPGDYEYACTYPGHFQAGMVGVLRVK